LSEVQIIKVFPVQLSSSSSHFVRLSFKRSSADPVHEHLVLNVSPGLKD